MDDDFEELLTFLGLRTDFEGFIRTTHQKLDYILSGFHERSERSNHDSDQALEVAS